MLSLPWEIFVLGLAIISIVNLALAFFVRDPSLSQVITVMDGIIIVFLGDLLRWLQVADDKRRYLLKGWGWVDASSIIPLLRVTRPLRVIRVMRRMGGSSAALTAFLQEPGHRRLADGAAYRPAGARVRQPGRALRREGPGRCQHHHCGDALWYLVATMSTVGYGDLYPVSQVGRVVGTIIIVVGVGVFGTLTGSLATVFLAPGSDAEDVAEVEDPDVETTAEGAAIA